MDSGRRGRQVKTYLWYPSEEAHLLQVIIFVIACRHLRIEAQAAHGLADPR